MNFSRFCIVLSMAFTFIFSSNAFSGEVVNASVGIHQSKIINLPEDFDKVVIGDRSVAGVVKHNAGKISVIGHKLGKTDVRLISAEKIVTQVNVTVTYNLSDIKQKINALFPNEVVGVELINSSIALTGVVSDAQTAEKVTKIVEQYISSKDSKIINLMKLRSGQQVMLRVRVGEIKRETLKRLGLGLHGVISAGASLFGILESEGSLKILAEPTLTSISGKPAQFLAGGEFPVPIAQADKTMSVEYKSFGVQVNFTPLVLSQNRVRLDVLSEVSELTNNVSVSLPAMKIPSIATRKASTTVELAPGESFMIAGLVKDNDVAKIHEVPGLADIPILAPLFRSAEFKRHETELVIAVTPYLVDPVESSNVRFPSDSYQKPSMMNMFLFGTLNPGKHGNIEENIEGEVGFITN